MKRRRLLSLLLCAAMLCSLMGTPALADEEAPEPATTAQETTSVGNDAERSDGADAKEEPKGAEESKGPAEGDPAESAGEPGGEQGSESGNEIVDPANPGTDSGLENGGAGENEDGGDEDSTGGSADADGSSGDGAEEDGGNAGEEAPGEGGGNAEANPDASEQDPDGEQTEVGEELPADDLMLLTASAPMPVAEAPAVKVTISVNGHQHDGNYYCPGATVTVRAENANLKSVTMNGVAQSVSGSQATFKAAASSDPDATTSCTVKAVADDAASTGDELTFKISHGSVVGSEDRSVINPTCTSGGKTLIHLRCSFCWEWCGYRTENTTEPLGHDFQQSQTVDLSKCGGTSEITVKTCSRCGFIEIEGGGEIDGDHVWEEVNEPATCKDPGKTYWRCKNCNVIDVSRDIVVTPNNPYLHRWSEWDPPLKELTCGTTLTSTRRCDVCQQTETYTETAPKGHDYSKKVRVEPNCTEAGSEETVCSRCGDVQNGSHKVLAPLGHDMQVDGEQPAQKCGEKGTANMKCSRCGATEERELPAKPHEIDLTKYTSDATGHWHPCKNCGEKVDGDSVVEPHKFPSLSPCGEDKVCRVCGYREANPTTEHTWVWWKNDVYHSASCSVCGKMLVSMMNHSFPTRTDCTQPAVCACGYAGSVFESHRMSISDWQWYYDENIHYKKCGNIPGCTGHALEEAHTWISNDCTKGVYCAKCKYVKPGTQKYSRHELSTPVVDHTQGDSVGIAVCQHEGCTYKEEVPHKIKERELDSKEATCTEPGFRKVQRYCEGCGTDIGDPIVTVFEKLDHTFGPWEDQQQSNCQSAGTKVHRCTVCGLEETEGVEPTAHTPGAWKTVKEAACLEDGSQEQRCTACGIVLDSKVIPALGHAFGAGTVMAQASCTSAERSTFTCTRTGCGHTKEEETRPALGHDFEYVYENDATCSQNGHNKGTCKRPGCGAVVLEEVPGTMVDHIFPNDDDCTTEEECAFPDCHVKSDTFKAHLPDGVWVVAGDKHYQMCARPNCMQKAIEEAHTPAGDDGNCLTPVLCTACGAEVKPGNDMHEFIHWTEDGANHVSDCEVEGCNQTTKRPHIFTTYIYNDDAACGVDGTETARCDWCTATDTRVKPGTALAHEADPTVPGDVTAPTCTEQGYTTYKCFRCKEAYPADFVDPLGHEPDLEYEPIVTAPTCVAQGFTTYACARCGEVYRDDFVPASGHKAAGEADRATTCTEPGYRGGTRCSVCGETLRARVAIPALGHSFGAWNASGGGSHTAACTRCGATRSESCGYSEIQIGATTVNVCKVCGDVVDPSGGETVTAGRFEVVADAASEEIDPGAIPAGCELIVRKLDVPFQETDEVMEAFTLGCELNGVALPLQGRLRVTMPVSCPMPFRLIRVDVVEDAQTGESTEQMVEIEFTYEDGRITFETDRDGMFLLARMDEAADAA